MEWKLFLLALVAWGLFWWYVVTHLPFPGTTSLLPDSAEPPPQMKR